MQVQDRRHCGFDHLTRRACILPTRVSALARHRFWINNQSRMYLLEGAGELHRQFGMNVGDVMVFAQKTDRTLVVAGRPATKVGQGLAQCLVCCG